MTPATSTILCLSIGRCTRNSGRGNKRLYRLRNRLQSWDGLLSLAAIIVGFCIWRGFFR